MEQISSGTKDSFKKRYAFKIVSNLFSVACSFVIQILVPRSLGAERYGSFVFLTDFFSRIYGFLEVNSVNALFVKVSKKPNEQDVVLIYWFYVITMLVLSVLLTVSILLFDTTHFVWGDIPLQYIWMALLYSFLMWLLVVFERLIDAYGHTVLGGLAHIKQKSLMLILTLVLFISGILNLDTFFISQFVALFYIFFSYSLILYRFGYRIFKYSKIHGERLRELIKYFWDFSAPTFAVSCLVLIDSLWERWFLEKTGGSIQNGYFGFAFRLANVSMLFVRAMYPLVTREISISFENKDHQKLMALYTKALSTLAGISAVIGAFICLWSDEIIHIMGGNEFLASKSSLILLAFLPFFIAISTLCTSYFLSTEKIRLYRNISLITLGFGPFLTFFLVSPTWGLNLAALGNSIKTITVFTTFDLLALWFISSDLSFSYFKELGKLIGTFVVLIGISFMVKILFWQMNSILFKLICGGIIYCLLVGLITYFYPKILGLNRRDIDNLISRLVGRNQINL